MALASSQAIAAFGSSVMRSSTNHASFAACGAKQTWADGVPYVQERLSTFVSGSFWVVQQVWKSGARSPQWTGSCTKAGEAYPSTSGGSASCVAPRRQWSQDRGAQQALDFPW